MDIENAYQLHKILIGRRTAIAKSDILAQMQCSESKFKRIREYMQNHLNAQIDYVREHNGYLYSNHLYELPGLWFATDELLALVSLEKLISGLNIGLLHSHLNPFKARIEKLLKNVSRRKRGLESPKSLLTASAPVSRRKRGLEKVQYKTVHVLFVSRKANRHEAIYALENFLLWLFQSTSLAA